MHDYDILVLPRQAFTDLPEQGVWTWSGWPVMEPHWHWRPAAERDEDLLQLIPYLVLRDKTGAIWSYARRGGDRRLLDRLSCGIGGHVERQDRRDGLTATLAATLIREAVEELGPPVAGLLAEDLEPQAWIYEHLTPIGRVHIGLLYTAVWPHTAPPTPREPVLESLGFLPAQTIRTDGRFEMWSRQVVDWPPP